MFTCVLFKAHKHTLLFFGTETGRDLETEERVRLLAHGPSVCLSCLHAYVLTCLLLTMSCLLRLTYKLLFFGTEIVPDLGD
jgi:hypothetical protein